MDRGCMDGKIVLVPECYANNHIAYMLREELRKCVEEPGEINICHTRVQGRDRIVKIAFEKALPGKTLIAVIDYEEGASRVFVERRFKLEEVASHILLGIGMDKQGVLAVVFDPRIEDALLCRASRDLCTDLSMRERIKSREASNVIERLIEDSDEVISIIRRLGERLCRLLAGGSPSSPR